MSSCCLRMGTPKIHYGILIFCFAKFTCTTTIAICFSRCNSSRSTPLHGAGFLYFYSFFQISLLYICKRTWAFYSLSRFSQPFLWLLGDQPQKVCFACVKFGDIPLQCAAFTLSVSHFNDLLVRLGWTDTAMISFQFTRWVLNNSPEHKEQFLPGRNTRALTQYSYPIVLVLSLSHHKHH